MTDCTVYAYVHVCVYMVTRGRSLFGSNLSDVVAYMVFAVCVEL